MERTVRSMAKELAGAFYEQNRSPRFRAAFPTLRHYMRGQQVMPDGQIKIYRPGWLHHVDMARKMLTAMLGRADVSEVLKERIYDALMEDREKSLRPGAKKLFQAGTQEHDTTQIR